MSPDPVFPLKNFAIGVVVGAGLAVASPAILVGAAIAGGAGMAYAAYDIATSENPEYTAGEYVGGAAAGGIGGGLGRMGAKKAISSLASKCFAAGTNVQTPDGEKNIEDINVGDIVYAFDFETNTVVERRVIETVSNFTYYWADVEVAGDTLQATRGHKFWVESENEWIEAAALMPEMSVRLSDGRISSVTKVSVRQLATPEYTYNLTVEHNHNYFVGVAGVLVHNGGPDFIVTPSGQVFPVPTGAQGPVAAINNAGKTMGFGFTGGSGGNGLDPKVSNLTFKDANWNQGARAAYMNKAGQKVNPYTGKTIGNAEPWSHIACP